MRAAFPACALYKRNEGTMFTAIVFLAATVAPAPPPPPGTFDKCYRDASVKTAVKAVLPKSLRAKYPNGASVKLAVQVDATGQAVSTNTYGTYDPELVSAAVAAAQKSTYVPAMYGCKPIENTILVTEEIAP
jgi:hypothetical protein